MHNGQVVPPPPFAPVAPVAPVTAHLSVDSDPHFMVHDTRDNLTVCFDIMGTPGDVISLVHDPILGECNILSWVCKVVLVR